MKFFYLILSLSVLSLGACKSDYDAPCRDAGVRQTFTLTSAQSAKYPYRLNDTIGFVSNSFDTILFLMDTVMAFETYKPTTAVGNPECPNLDVDAYRNVQSLLRDSLHSINFAPIFRRDNDSCYFFFNSTGVSAPIASIGDTLTHYRDSVVLLSGKTFYKVNILTNGLDSMMVNAGYGVVYFTYLGKVYNQYKYNSK